MQLWFNSATLAIAIWRHEWENAPLTQAAWVGVMAGVSVYPLSTYRRSLLTYYSAGALGPK